MSHPPKNNESNGKSFQNRGVKVQKKPLGNLPPLFDLFVIREYSIRVSKVGEYVDIIQLSICLNLIIVHTSRGGFLGILARGMDPGPCSVVQLFLH